jgi:sulfite reductase (NADPH) flavoprotein alpha-component
MPLDAGQAAAVDTALAGLTPAQLQWVSGYAAGLAAAAVPGIVPAAQPVAQGRANVTLTILYGSQTGNGEGIARELTAAAESAGFQVKLASLADYRPNQLKREALLTFVVSTHGEGDPPDDAELFHEFLLSPQAPKLGGVRYSVLALGDSSYVNYCQTGREFDARLAELGAERLAPIVECDVDYDEPAARWVEEVVARLQDELEAPAAVPQLRAVAPRPRFDRNNPFRAEVLANQKITGRHSTKDVRHIELSLEDSGLTYEPGDALAVVADNPPALVGEVIDQLALDGAAFVAVGDERIPLADALCNRLEITALSLGFLKDWAARSGGPLSEIVAADDRAALTELLRTHQLIDIIRRYPAAVCAQEFADSLRKLAPRAYSIASSPAANPDEVHLTVAAVRYTAFGTEHWGAASTFLADRIEIGDAVSVYVEPNKRFRLPADDGADVLMIGAGTGVAPFRAFVEHRAQHGATGRNWLFFGDRTFADDFLYQVEWQRHLREGALTRLDMAFSRDQADKVYVQDRIREQGDEVWHWIRRGAHIYVCGDATRMAGDVERALVDVIAEHGGLSRDAAAAELKALRQAGRYQRDVY